MRETAGYTFSKKRMIIHTVLLVLTLGNWAWIGVPWELYRYFNK